MNNFYFLHKIKVSLLCITILIFNLSCTSNSQKDNFKTDKVRKYLKEGIPVLLYFYAESIPESVKIKPSIDRLSNEMKKEVKIFAIDADKYSDFAISYEVTYVPDLILLKPNKSITDRFVVDVEEKDLYRAIKNNVLSKNTKKVEKKIKERKPVLLFFYTDWCFYCRKLMPMIKEFEKEYSNKVGVIWVNIENDTKMADNFSIPGVPIIVILDKDGLISDRYGGFGTSKKKLIHSFEKTGIKMK